MFAVKATRTLLGAGAIVLAFGAAAPAQTVAATSNFAAEQAFAAATGVTKQAAIAIALKAVGGGTVVQAIFERQDRIPHWSVDIILAPHDYEVWVSGSGQVIRIIKQKM